MSDWTYITIAYVLAWGGLTVYALTLARRVLQARRLERRLREVIDAEAARSSIGPEAAQARSMTAGWQAEGDRSACDVPPAS